MSAAALSGLLRFVRRWTGGPACADADLLRRCLREGDESAFAELLERHGPLVLGVCRRLLDDVHDVEDAFQATFLVLLRRGGSLSRPERLASWLHGVAHRTALKARGQARRRRPTELTADLAAAVAVAPERRELLAALEEEVRRLPERLRTPVVLCYLEGLGRAEAARRLGDTEGSVKGRLERGRELLRQRLRRRGFTAVEDGLPALLGPAVPAAALSRAVTQAAIRAAGGPLNAAVSPTVLTLIREAEQAMWLSKVKALAAL